MGTIAEKLTYLNNTKQLLKENINNLGGNLTNEPFRQYASVLEGIYESLPKVSGIGASLSLSPSMVGKIKLNEIQGDTLQQNTPTPDSPVPIQSVTGLQNASITGKNLFKPFNFTKTTSNVEFTYNEDGSITSDGTATGLAVSMYSGEATPYLILLEPGTYTISGSTSSVQLEIVNSSGTAIQRTGSTSTYATFTLSTTTKIFIRAYIASGTQVNNVTIYPQLEQGSTATTYEPYKGNTYEVNLGNIELNKIGTYEDSIKKSTGKNLFDGTIYKENYVINSSGVESYNTSFNLYKISLKPNTTYTIQFKSTDSAIRSSRYIAYKNDGTFISMVTEFTYNAGESVTQTFTTPNETSYILYHIGKLVENVMLNEGTALPYEPYGKVWYVEKNIGKYVYNNDLSNNSLTTDSVGMLTPELDIVANTRPLTNIAICNMMGSVLTNNTGLDGTTSTNRIRVNMSTSYVSSYNEFKTLASNNNLTIYYGLKTPTYTVITNTELINQLESLYNAKSEDGTTNINVTSEDLSMILNVGVLKGE